MTTKALGAQKKAGPPRAGLRVLKVEYVDVETLRPYAGNPRTHGKRQVQQIESSIGEFGWTTPILVDEEGNIIGGHGRLEAAKRVGLTTVPVIRLTGLSEVQKRACALADNKIADNAGWDDKLLATELQFISGQDVDFDATVTGFEVGEIDFRIDSLEQVPEEDPADEIPDPTPDRPPVTEEGDLWLLGANRLLCGDARDGSAFDCLTAGEKAQMVLTDPPFNIPIAGNVSGAGAVKHGDFVMGSGEMSDEEYRDFLHLAFAQHARHCRDGAIVFVCGHWRCARPMLEIGEQVFTELKNICTWVKTNAGMGSFYRSQHELIFVFKSGSGQHINNFELGQYGRRRTNVWSYPGLNSLHADRSETLALHPTVKPVALVADAIKDCSKRGGIILDGFAGSGTTIIAAERTGRVAYAIELDPKYVDTAVRRWEAFTGEQAVHAVTGLTFGQAAEEQLPAS